MKARIRKLLSDLSDTFWLVPALMVLGGVLAGVGFVELDRSDVLPEWLLKGPWLYNGGGTGARTMLGAIASSTIGVAGTVFAITIAALSLAAGQMGPRLLRNFTRDRGNQFTLGAFLGTFSYALMVLRSVRTQNEGEFVPHLSLSVGILLAFLCVATLVYFVGHMAGRINVDTVIDLVSDDVRSAICRLTSDAPHPVPPPSVLLVTGYSRVRLTGEGTCSSSTIKVLQVGPRARHLHTAPGASRRLCFSRRADRSVVTDHWRASRTQYVTPPRSDRHA